MTKALNVLFMPHNTGPEMTKPWLDEVDRVIGKDHNLRVFDDSQPLASEFEDVDVVIDLGGVSATNEIADLIAGKVRLWQILGTGIDHFDLEYWRAKKISVANCPGQFTADALAEGAMMFILMLTRRYSELQINFKRGIFYRPLGLALEGMRLGIIGFGASGMALARRALAFDMKISAIDIRDVSDHERREFDLEFVGKPDSIDQVITQSDVLSLHLHLTDETHHIIDERRLKMMKPGSFLINIARGQLVDEDVLLDLLEQKKIGGAGLDAFGKEPPEKDSLIYTLDNVLVTPHTAGATTGSVPTAGAATKRAHAAKDNLDRIASGLDPLYLVN